MYTCFAVSGPLALPFCTRKFYVHVMVDCTVQSGSGCYEKDVYIKKRIYSLRQMSISQNVFLLIEIKLINP